MIPGKNIALRALEKEDLLQLRDWRNNENFRKFFREYQELNLENQNRWFDRFVVCDSRTLMFGIIRKKDKQLIGVNGLCYIDWVNRSADLSLYIGANDIYVDTMPDGYCWESLDLLFEYAFNRINLHKIWTEIYSFDKNKHELYESYGMHQDAVLPDNYFYDGCYQDSHIYSILEHEWRERHRAN